MPHARPVWSPPNVDEPSPLLDAFHQIRSDLFATLVSLLENEADAQDVLQVAFLRCWQARGRLADVQNVRFWLWRIALNAAKDLMRASWRRRAKPLDHAGVLHCPRSSPVDTVVSREELGRVRHAVGNLRLEEKEAFLLRHDGGFTMEEIAQLRNRPIGTVKTHMRTAVRKLREALQEKQTAWPSADGFTSKRECA